MAIQTRVIQARSLMKMISGMLKTSRDINRFNVIFRRQVFKILLSIYEGDFLPKQITAKNQ